MLRSRTVTTLSFLVSSALLFIGISACSHGAGTSSLPVAVAQGHGVAAAANVHVPHATQPSPIPCVISGVATPAPVPPPTYQNLILGDYPSAYYELADSSTTLTDSGSAHVSGVYGTAVSHGSKAITMGAASAATFPGGSTYNSQGYAYTPKSAVLQPACPTMEAWFSLSAPNATQHDLPIITYGSIGRGARYGLFVHGLGGGQQCLQVQLRAAGQPAYIGLSHIRLNINTVYHVVATFDSYNVVTFINGVVDGVAPYSGQVDYTPYFSDGLQIGGGDQALPWASASFPGTIAQVAIYASPLMALQVENHYLGGQLLAMQTETPSNSDKFVDSIGLNAHFDNQGSIYGTQFPQVKNLLVGLGVRHLRAGINYNNPVEASEMQQLAASGVYASYVTQLGMTQAQIQAWPDIVGASFEQYEAPNEQDDVGNPNWLPGCIAFQQSLFSWVKGDPHIARFPVLGPSIVRMQDSQLLGNQSANLDFGNIHDYFSVYNPGTYGWGNVHPPFGIYGSISFNLNIGRTISGSKPIEATETGYGTVAGNPLTLDYRAHLRYMTRLFFEQFNNGIVRSYSYELMDEGGSSVFNNFGLITTALQPKPAYTGLQSIINALKDPGLPFVTTPLSYELSGSTDPVHHTLLQKHNGHYVMAIWLEVQSWVTVNNAGGDIIVAPQTIALTTGRHFSSATIATMDENGNMTSAPLPWSGTGSPITITDKVSLVDLAP